MKYFLSLPQEVNKLREKYGQEAKEKARLAGNRNHLERIKYLERINQERNEISHVMTLLSQHVLFYCGIDSLNE